MFSLTAASSLFISEPMEKLRTNGEIAIAIVDKRIMLPIIKSIFRDNLTFPIVVLLIIQEHDVLL